MSIYTYFSERMQKISCASHYLAGLEVQTYDCALLKSNLLASFSPPLIKMLKKEGK